MEIPIAALLEKTRLPQPSFQRFAVISLFRRLESAHRILGPASAAGRDAVSQCLRSPSAAVVDQAVRELCRLVAAGGRLPISGAFIELQSALEGCEPRFAPVLVKGIGFLCRLAFRTDSSWGRRFDRVELHPFVKVLSCCEEARKELIQQVLLFIACNKSFINEVGRFLRPFIMFSVISKPSSTCSYFFSRLISSIAQLLCTFPLEAISILNLLAESLKYLPLTNVEESLYIVSSAVPLVDAYIVVLQQTVRTKKEAIFYAQRCSVDVLSMLLSACAYLYGKTQGQVESVIEMTRHLLVVQKELGLHYAFEFVKIVVSASVILTQVEFEHDQLCVLKLLILLMEWKTEELRTKRALYSLREELLVVFPAINLLSSPSKSVKAAVTHLLSLAEIFLLDFMGATKNAEVSCTDLTFLNEVESFPLRLLHHFFSQDQYSFYQSYFYVSTCDKVPHVEEKCYEPLNWLLRLRKHLLTIEKAKAASLKQHPENQFEGMIILLGSVTSTLVLYPAFDTSAVDSLVALGLHDPKLGMTLLQAALFYKNILCNFKSNSSRILLGLLEMLPTLASHSAMVQLVVQTILPMLQKDAKPSLYAVAVRLLCKTWVVSDRVFETLQGVLDPKAFSNFGSEREICMSIAASVRDVCKHNPDRGVDLILSVSSSIENEDCTVKALGLQSLASLCEADVVDFYTAWEVISKHVNHYLEDPIVATGLATLLRWGAIDVAAYPDTARCVLQILFKIGTFRSGTPESLWVNARTSAFKSLIHYEIVDCQEIVPEFKEKNLQCLLNECNAEVLEALEEFEIKIINFEHINQRRALKGRRTLGHKVEKLLDVFPQVLFSPGTGNLNLSSRELPGAALLSYVFTPKELQGLSNDVPKVHAPFKKALMDIAESLPLSRNILIALLALESWKAFIQHWLKALVTSTDAKGSSIELDNSSNSAGEVLKICCKVAEESVPQVSANTILAIGALCLVVPSSSYAIISYASDFLLNWLVDYEHEHRQWSSAISLGLISNYFHATDTTHRVRIIKCLLKVASNSQSHLVIGACGVGLGFACQGLLTSAEVDSNRPKEATLLVDVIRTLSMILSQLCPHASDSLKNLIESILLDDYYSTEDSSLLPQQKPDNLEEDTWGIAGLVLGLGNSVGAVFRLGAYDAVLKIKDILLSWVPSVDLFIKNSSSGNSMTNIPLAVGACITIPTVIEFCQKVGLMIDNIDAILIHYGSLVSELLNSEKSRILYQNLLMASCIGAGSFVSCILSYGMHPMRYDDIKHLLEILRSSYAKSHPSLIHLGGMIGVINAFGAAAGDLTCKQLQPSFLPISHELQGSNFIRGPILLSPTCEKLCTSFVQELFLIAKESYDQQLRKSAAWAVSFLRHRWWSEEFHNISGSESISRISSLQPQSFDEGSLVWKMCVWLTNINCYQVHSRTVAAVLRCLSKAPKLPVLNWASIIRGFMKNAAQFQNKSEKSQPSTSFREECIAFSVARAKDVNSLLLFLDELTDLSRFWTLEINLQCLLLSHVFDLLKIFSASRMERLFQDFAQFFSSSNSPYLVYRPGEKVLLRVSLWKGLCQCLNEANNELSCFLKIEKCMECLFCFLPTIVSNANSEVLQSTCSEWSEAIRCLAKARCDWLVDFLQLSVSTTTEKAIQILAKVRLVKIGGLPFSELESLKSYVLNFNWEGMWWSVLVEVVATLSIAELSIKRQWLLDALEISCISEYPSTAIRFIGLLSGSCCIYMPLLIIDPEFVLRDLPLTMPSLLSTSGWSNIAEPSAGKLWLSTERICTWAARLSSGANISIPDSNPIDEGETHASVLLSRVMHQTCLSLKDYLPFDKRLRLANLEVP